MHLSVKDTDELLKLIDKNQLVVIGSELGEEYLTEYDRQILRQYGVNYEALFSAHNSSIHTSF